ncbi:phospholipase D family protein [Photobacterium damselae subsp. damselae]|uniref:phospholipase D family protein n=1 Tax=Photobacterium damselae TaxID=38293 RepID=UPI00311B2A73
MEFDFDNGIIVFTTEFYRQSRHLLIGEDRENVSQFWIKCPNIKCQAVIACSEAYTQSLDCGLYQVPACDEDGFIQGECDNCNTQFKIKVINPELASFNNGATNIDYGYGTASDIYDAKRTICDNSISDGTTQVHKTTFDYEAQPLYLCDNCGKNAETQLLSAFKNDFDSFFNGFDNYMGFTLSRGHGGIGGIPADILVRIEFECTCGQKHVGYMNRKYSESYDFEVTDFSIVNITGTTPIDQVIKTGVYVKDLFLSWLFKLLPRWALIYERVYIITPFVGHPYLKPEVLVSLWTNLIQRLDTEKSKIFVRGGQKKLFINAYNKLNEQPYSELEDYKLSSSLISNIKNKNFHAKVYCGIGRKRSEVLSGSANLVGGKTMEFLNFEDSTDLGDINTRYLLPLGINADFPEHERSYAILFDSATGYKDKVVFNTDYHDCILHDQIPKYV